MQSDAHEPAKRPFSPFKWIERSWESTTLAFGPINSDWTGFFFGFLILSLIFKSFFRFCFFHLSRHYFRANAFACFFFFLLRKTLARAFLVTQSHCFFFFDKRQWRILHFNEMIKCQSHCISAHRCTLNCLGIFTCFWKEILFVCDIEVHN